jgi:predicted GNAT superfamily acetyltransferase
MTAPGAEILIRPCHRFDEFEACVRLQLEIWGYEERDTVPQREFVVIDRIGGHIMGAFDLSKSKSPQGESNAMIGFAMAMPAMIEGRFFLHSHMLAVLPEYRNLGIGRKLKLAQRDEALTRGITRMEWTFDPLEIKNAYLNIARLGAIVHRYSPNAYGVFSSRLQAGLPTDRLHAEWYLDSPRVLATLNGAASSGGPESQETIVVPGAIRAWKQSASEFPRAVAAQDEIRARFLDAFQRGLMVSGFSKRLPRDGSGSDGEGDGVYHLTDWREP